MVEVKENREMDKGARIQSLIAQHIYPIRDMLDPQEREFAVARVEGDALREYVGEARACFVQEIEALVHDEISFGYSFSPDQLQSMLQRAKALDWMSYRDVNTFIIDATKELAGGVTYIHTDFRGNALSFEEE